MKKYIQCGILIFGLILVSYSASSFEVKENTEYESLIYYKAIEKECDKYNVDFGFVQDVIETDRSLGVEGFWSEKEQIDLVKELAGYFVKYEDTYAVILCHHYGEEDAVIMTNTFQYWLEDNVYSELFYSIEKERLEKENGGK